MANDTISRQAAIDALNDEFTIIGKTNAVIVQDYIRRVNNRLRSLPSAQSEHPSEIQDILDYLDTALHPIISPEYWNVYSELYDMVSTLPSAERRGRWVDLKCDQCGQVDMSKPNYCPNCGSFNGEGGENEELQR